MARARGERRCGERLLTREPGLGEQNGPLVHLLTAVFAGAAVYFLRLFPLSRFKANFGCALFVS